MWMIVTDEQAVIGTKIYYKGYIWRVASVTGVCPIHPKLRDANVHRIRPAKPHEMDPEDRPKEPSMNNNTQCIKKQCE